MRHLPFHLPFTTGSVATLWAKCILEKPIATSFLFLFHMADAGIRDIWRASAPDIDKCHINELLLGSWKWPGSFPTSNFMDLTLVRVPPDSDITPLCAMSCLLSVNDIPRSPDPDALPSRERHFRDRRRH